MEKVTLMLGKADYDKILQHCVEALPEEACGLLAGTVSGAVKTVTKVYMLTNMDASSEHFSMNPEEQFAAQKDAREQGAVIIGNFHSHTQSLAVPSEEDRRLAYDSSMEYLILSLMDRMKPELRAFGIDLEKNVEEHRIRQSV